MKSDVVESCTACGAPAATRDPFFYDWKESRYWVYRCGECSHQFVFPTVTETDQLSMYGDDYFSAEGDWVCGLFGGKSYKDSQPELIKEAEEILDLIPSGTGSLLDLGCAGGVFLQAAQSSGYTVHGIEINPSMAEYARTTFGVSVTNEPIERIPTDRWQGSFDVVTILDVLEHIPDPLGTLAKVRHWIRRDGFLLVRGPLSNSRTGHLKEAVRRSLGLNKRLPGYPLDANMFNRRSLTALFRATGFRPERWWPSADFANVLAVADGESRP
jgi:SAM-dependent methyltransferase